VRLSSLFLLLHQSLALARQQLFATILRRWRLSFKPSIRCFFQATPDNPDEFDVCVSPICAVVVEVTTSFFLDLPLRNSGSWSFGTAKCLRFTNRLFCQAFTLFPSPDFSLYSPPFPTPDGGSRLDPPTDPRPLSLSLLSPFLAQEKCQISPAASDVI